MRRRSVILGVDPVEEEATAFACGLLIFVGIFVFVKIGARGVMKYDRHFWIVLVSENTLVTLSKIHGALISHFLGQEVLFGERLFWRGRFKTLYVFDYSIVILNCTAVDQLLRIALYLITVL